MKIKRKKKLINASFQLRIAVISAVITLVSFSVIIAFLLFFTGSLRTDSIAGTARELDRAVEDEDYIVRSFKEYSKRVKDPIFMLATEKIEIDHKKSIGVIRENIKILKAYSERNRQFLVVTLVIMALNAALLFVYLLRSTHRAAGPVQVMARHVRDLLEGRKPDLRRLRKKDEFQEFYSDFIRLAERYQRKSERKEKDRNKKTAGS